MNILDRLAGFVTISVFATLATIASGGSAHAADITFLCASAMQSTVQELLPAFEKASGHHVKADYTNVGEISQRLRRGDEADLAIVSPQQWDSLREDGKIIDGWRVAISKVGVGLSVRKGAARPNIDSVETFKLALLNARSIAVGDPNKGSPAGIYTMKLLDRLGIASEIKPKLQLISPGPGNIIADAVAKGGAEIGIDQLTLILASPEVDLVGPLPADIQNFTIFTAAIPTTASQPTAAQALIAFLTSAQAIAAFKAKGFATN